MKTMVRRPALTAACCLSAGILWGQHATLPVWVWATVGAVLFLLSLNRSPSGRFVRCSAASCLVLVAWTGALLAAVEGRWFPAGHVVRFACPPRRSVLSGVLIRDPAARNGRFDLLVESDSLADGSASRAIRGRVLISVYGSDAPDFRYGDVVRTSGILSRPGPGRNPGGFDYREWLGRSGIHALLKPEPGGGPIRVGGGRGRGFLRKAVYPCRRFVLSLIDSTVPDPESRSLLRSLTLGDQGLISSDLRDDFSRTGVVHILSVSGSHVGFMFIILSLLMGCLRVPEPFRSAAVAAGLIFYALLTEASAPVVRATVMAVTALAAVRLERKVDPFNTLGLAAFGILLFRPLDLTDPGFQLSFLSVLSILAGYGKFRVFMTRLDSGRKKAVWKRMETVMAGAVVSMSAQAGTLAISARLFNCIPLLSIPANAVAVPISGAILAVSAATVAAAPVHAGLVTAYASLNRFLLTVFIRSIDWISGLPLSAVTVPSPSLGGILFLYGSAGLLFAFRHASVRKTLTAGLLILLNLWVWPRALRPASRAVTWVQFDVGQGDAGLFRFPGGETLLIDAGPMSPSFDCGERTLAPFLRRTGIRRLDVMVLTHPHLDHIGGACALLNRFPVGLMLAPAVKDSAKAYGRLAESCGRGRVPIRLIRDADSLVFSRAVKIILLKLPAASGGESSICREETSYIRSLTPGQAPGNALAVRFNPSTDEPRQNRSGGSDNESSLIMVIACGRTRWLSMGDAGIPSEETLATAWKGDRCDAVKIGHHGSAYSTSGDFLSRFNPRLAVVSVGAGNRYGHPSGETLKRISAAGCVLLRTDEKGAVIFETDGTQTRVVDWRKASGFRGLIRGIVSGPFVSRYGI
jgi:competence protein ComEC